MVYGIAKMLNFAHGDVIMVGAYVCFFAVSKYSLPPVVGILLAVVVCTVLGIVVEALCHIEYWNYSNIPMHITKYTSIPTSTAFAAMITILMGNVFPVLMDWICRINTQWAKIICAVLWIVMVADFFISFGHMIKAKNFYLKWKIFLRAKK